MSCLVLVKVTPYKLKEYQVANNKKVDIDSETLSELIDDYCTGIDGKKNSGKRKRLYLTIYENLEKQKESKAPLNQIKSRISSIKKTGKTKTNYLHAIAKALNCEPGIIQAGPFFFTQWLCITTKSEKIESYISLPFAISLSEMDIEEIKLGNQRISIQPVKGSNYKNSVTLVPRGHNICIFTQAIKKTAGIRYGLNTDKTSIEMRNSILSTIEEKLATRFCNFRLVNACGPSTYFGVAPTEKIVAIDYILIPLKKFHQHISEDLDAVNGEVSTIGQKIFIKLADNTICIELCRLNGEIIISPDKDIFLQLEQMIKNYFNDDGVEHLLSESRYEEV